MAINRLTTNDPDEFVAAVSAVAASTSIQPRAGGPLRADIRAARLSNLGIMRIDARNVRVRSSSRRYTGITIPLVSSFEIRHQDRENTFTTGCAHVLHPDQPFDLRISKRCTVLVLNIDALELKSASAALSDAARGQKPAGSYQHLDLNTRHGAILWRHAAELWRCLRHSERTINALAITELERAVGDQFVLATGNAARRLYTGRHGSRMRRVEDYVVANLKNSTSLSDLCRVADLNARTLAREFHKRHQVSPVRFVRERRLDSVYRTLMASEPEQFTVTQIATDHGFYHLGRFSSEYLRAFGEKPSDTLNGL